MKKLLFVVVLGLLLSCSRDRREVKKESRGVITAVIHTKDGTNGHALLMRSIYVSGSDGDKAIWDTAYVYEDYVMRDSTGKAVRDSAGNLRAGSKPVVTAIGKDSVKWQGIEGVPLDSILRSFKPKVK